MARGDGTSREFGGHRTALTILHALQWISSVIVMGIASYYIAHYHSGAGEVIVFTEAVINVVTWILGIILPFFNRYRGHLSPYIWIMSYLWLTAFILQTQSYNYRDCATNAPYSPIGTGSCTRKRALEAFTFLTFIFTVILLLLEVALIRRYLGSGDVGTGAGTGVGTNGAMNGHNKRGLFGRNNRASANVNANNAAV